MFNLNRSQNEINRHEQERKIEGGGVIENVLSFKDTRGKSSHYALCTCAKNYKTIIIAKHVYDIETIMKEELIALCSW